MCWLDLERMKPGVYLDDAMRDGIERSKVVVVFLDEAYLASKNCRTELIEAVRLRKHIVPGS